jgi:UDP-glucose:(heptosyl)LPS alpha-1,3-glucosyltransferase
MSRVKKIALAVENFSRYKGGAESYAVSLAVALAENGWQVHLFGEEWDGEPPSAIFHRISTPTFLPSWARMILFALKHRRMVMGEEFDVILGFGNTIHMNVYQSHGGVHRLYAKRKVYAKSNRILRFFYRLLRLISIKDKVRQWVESTPFRMNPRPRIVAISQMVRRDMASFYKVNENEIDLIYNGVDTERFNPEQRERLRGAIRQRLGMQGDDIGFLFVAYDLGKKGIVPLIEASGQLRRSGIDKYKVLVLGGKPHVSLLRRMAKLGLKDTVVFLGSTRNPEEFYANADVLVLPTFYDACSLVVIEAMSCGLPAITTVTNGASGIITNGKDGFVISHPPSPAELANAMRSVMSPERLSKMSKEAVLTAKNYSLEDNHRRMMTLFSEVGGEEGSFRRGLSTGLPG